MNEIWNIKKRKHKDIINQLLANRGIDLSLESKRKFFNPDFNKDVVDPKTINNISKAIDRILIAQKNNENVGLFADYDADGIPGAALLYKALTKIGIKTYIYIPDRDQGYGISFSGIDYLNKKKCTLIISIDLGIKNFDEAINCQEKKIDLIITDHHLPDKKLPNAFLVINPKVENEKSPSADLCGCGLVYKLVSALSTHFPKEIDEKFLKWNLDLVAISTISDVVPLTLENRILAKYGLIVLRKTKNIGLQELYKVAQIKKTEIDAYTAGFKIGPRINAPGRIDKATKSFELLVTLDRQEAEKLALDLNKKNENRQAKMGEAIDEATEEIIKNKLNKNKIIILCGSWVKGILGPSASRISELFFRPVILFTKEDETYVGSARSVAGIDIINLLNHSKKFILRFGGHHGAAGLTVQKNKFNQFKNNITKYANEIIKESELSKSINIDLEIDPNEVSIPLIEKINEFQPFGYGNSTPVMMIKNVKILQIKNIGKDNKHLSFYIEKNNRKFRAIYFNYDPVKIPTLNKNYDIAFNLKINEWNNNKNIDLNIISIRDYNAKK